MCPAFLQFWCNVIYCKSAYKNGFHCYLNENLRLNVYAGMFWELVYKMSYPNIFINH